MGSGREEAAFSILSVFNHLTHRSTHTETHLQIERYSMFKIHNNQLFYKVLSIKVPLTCSFHRSQKTSIKKWQERYQPQIIHNTLCNVHSTESKNNLPRQRAIFQKLNSKTHLKQNSSDSKTKEQSCVFC